MLSFKQTVLIYGLRPEMVLVNYVVDQIFSEYGYDCTITSGRDSHNGRVSLHDCTSGGVPVCFALDYRSVHITNRTHLEQIKEKLTVRLPFCDVLLHSVPGSVEHFHIEFDPKNDPVFQAKKELWKRGEKVQW